MVGWYFAAAYQHLLQNEQNRPMMALIVYGSNGSYAQSARRYLYEQFCRSTLAHTALPYTVLLRVRAQREAVVGYTDVWAVVYR